MINVRTDKQYFIKIAFGEYGNLCPKIAKTEKLGDLQLILSVANFKITFPSGKSPWKTKKSYRSGITFCSKSNKIVLTTKLR